MRKFKIIIISMLFILITALAINMTNVYAANINSIEPTGYTHTGNYSDGLGNSMWYTNQPIEKIVINGEVGFCVEPYKLVGQWGNYTPNTYQNDLLSKIVYHGYWNTSRTNYDYAVTQIMIWKALGQPPTSTSIPNFSVRESEISNAISNHMLVPSFHGSTITLNKGESIEINDTNGVISSFSPVSNSTSANYTITGNKITINANDSNSGKIVLSRYRGEFIKASILYDHPTSQDVATLHLQDPLRSDLNIRISSGRLKFSKTGEVFTHTLTGTSESGSYQEPQWQLQKLLGAEITICAAEDVKDHSGNLLYAKDKPVQTIESTYDDDYSDWLPSGKYYWYESKVPFGYIEDLTKNYFEITDAGGSDQNISADLYNERAQQIFVFNKSMEKHDVKKYQNDEAYKDVVYGIYTRDDTYDYKGNIGIPNDTMLQQFIINENGEAKASRIWDDINSDGIQQIEELSYLDLKLNLPIGNYYLKELNTNSAFNLDTKEYDFSIDYQGQSMQNITLLVNNGNTIINELKDFKIRVNKVDSYSKVPIRSRQFGFSIYSNLECTDLVQKVNANILDGTATFTEIHYGEYWIKETSAPLGYMISQEIKHLKINENGVFINGEEITEENGVYSFIYGNQIIPSTGDSTNVGGFSFLMLISAGVILIFYLKNKKEEK